MTLLQPPEVDRSRPTVPEASVTIEVALGRRVMVVGDLLLPAEPSPS